MCLAISTECLQSPGGSRFIWQEHEYFGSLAIDPPCRTYRRTEVVPLLVNPMPTAYLIAGPNGAGKTTFARDYLPNEVGCFEFINNDLIALS